MKLKITLGLMIAIFAFSCKKDSNQTNAALLGKWNEVSATGGGTGQGVYFTALTQGPPYVTFLDSGKIQSTLFINCIKYSLSGSKIALTFYNTPANSTTTYDYSIHQDTLIMNDESCVGCQVVLAKQ